MAHKTSHYILDSDSDQPGSSPTVHNSDGDEYDDANYGIGSKDSVGDNNSDQQVNKNNITLSENSINELATKLAEAMKLLKEKKHEDECWIASDETLMCRPCQKFSSGSQVPPALRKFRKTNWGFVTKKNVRKNNIQTSVMRHESSELHKWCVLNEKCLMDTDKDVEKKDKEAGMLVIRNVIHCIKRGQSAEDFVCLNNINHLTPGTNAAVKNNSRKAFMEVRDLVTVISSSQSSTLVRSRA
jgi:hypothetical protein